MADLFVEDDSGDRKYFTMLPNCVLNHSTAVDQALYCQIKRFAGENGECYASAKTLMEKLGVSRNTLKKSFRYLLDRGWIKYTGEKDVGTSGGLQKVKAYKIVDIWKLNSEHYQGGVKIDAPRDQRGVKIVTKGCQNSAPKKNHIIKTTIAETSSADWDLEKKLKEMEADKNSHLDIIATFIREKGVKIENSKQLSAVISRYLRIAKKLSGAYTNEQIFSAVDRIKKENAERKRRGEEGVDYTLETVMKMLTK